MVGRPSRRQLLAGTAGVLGTTVVGGAAVGTAVSSPGDGEILLGPRTGASERSIGETTVGPVRSGADTHPLDTGGDAVRVRLLARTEDHLLGTRNERAVEDPSRLPAGVDATACLRALAVRRTFEYERLSVISIQEGLVNQPDPPTAAERYARWIGHARTVAAEGDPAVGASRFITEQLEALEHFGTNVADRIADVIEAEVPSDVLGLVRVVLQFLESTEVGQDVVELGEAIADAWSALKALLATVPRVHQTAGWFVNGRDGFVGVPAAVETIQNRGRADIDYHYAGQVIFGRGLEMTLFQENGTTGVAESIRLFASAIDDMYAAYADLVAAVDRIAAALGELPSATAQSLSQPIRLLATAMDFAGRQGREQYVEPIEWCVRNSRALHDELAARYQRLRRQFPAEATNVFGDHEGQRVGSVPP